jgi:ribosomal protein S18 acetylase RimI-like enzyme
MTEAQPPVGISVEIARELKRGDLADLCEAAADAILAGGGFGWLKPPRRDVMEGYWKGVLMVPDRTLFLGRLDGVICGSAQLVRPTRNNEAQAHSANLTTSFMAPWARGHGLARLIALSVENHARALGVQVLNLDVRETQQAAITLYRSLGYQEIGRHPRYAEVGGKFVAGLYFWKDLGGAPVTETSR